METTRQYMALYTQYRMNCLVILKKKRDIYAIKTSCDL